MLKLYVFMCTCLPCASCYLLKPSTIKQHAQDEYYLHIARLEIAFERELYFNASYYDYLEKRTHHIYTLPSLSEEKRLLLQRYHRKLKSIIAYVNLAKAAGVNLDKENILQDSEVAVLLQEMLRTSAQDIDTTKAKEFPFQAKEEKRQAEFYRLLLNKALQSTQQVSAKYRQMFPFATLSDAASFPLPQTSSRAKPVEKEHAPKTYTPDSLAKAMNVAIHKLNRAKAEIENVGIDLHGKDTALDFEHPEVRKLMQGYEQQMGKLADNLLLPLFFTEVFRQQSGTIGFERNFIDKLTKASKMLNNLTVQSAADCANDLLQTLGKYEQTLKQRLQSKLQLDADAANWILNNEILAAHVLVQYPQYIPVYLYLSTEYLDDSRNALRYLLRAAGVITLGAIIYAALPLSAGSAALLFLKRAVMVSNLANLGWLGMSVEEAYRARNHRLYLERSLMIGTSNRVGKGLKLLRKFEKEREWVVFSLLKNMTMTAMPIGVVMRGVHNSMKEDVQNFLKQHVNAD